MKKLRLTRRTVAGMVASLLVLAGDQEAAARIMRGHGIAVTPPPPVSPAFTTFTVSNWSASTSKCRYRRGLWFAKGDVPSGSIPVITRSTTTITAQFDERTTWEDGSLKVCVLSMIDTDFAGLETRTYSIKAQVGSFNNTSLRSLADLGSHDFKVEFTNLTQSTNSSGTDGPTNTTTRGSGTFTGSLNTQSAVATRVQQYHAGPVCTSYKIWGMATDNTGGAEDAHLKQNWYVTFWNNADGTLNDIEYGAVVAQDWWRVTNKYRLNYTATLKDGATTIETYATIKHPYRSQWMTVRKNNDNNHARRFWVNAIPTLIHTFDKDYARSTGLFGYFDPNFTPNTTPSPAWLTYVPCSAQGHRANVDGTGAYGGRGLMPNTDVTAWMLQNPWQYRLARVNAFAGLHIVYHYRSSDTRTFPAGDPLAGQSDTANTVIPLIMRPLPAGDYDFRDDGMPAAIDAYIQGVTSGATPALTATYVAPVGGNGVWSFQTNDASHGVAYCYGMYMLEGERHFMEATIDLGMNTVHNLKGEATGSGGAPRANYYGIEPFQSRLSIPNTQYSGIAQQYATGNIRKAGWAMLLMAQAGVVCPDNDPQSLVIRIVREQSAAFTKFNMTYMPPEQLQLGVYGYLTGSNMIYVYSPWQSNFQLMGHAFHAIANENADSQWAVENCLQYAAMFPWEDGTQMVASTAYRMCTSYKTGTTWNATTNPFVTRANLLLSGSVGASGNFVSIGGYIPPTNGDVVYWIRSNSTPDLVPIPAGFTEATPYYLVNVSGDTAQLAATPGGTPIPIEDNFFAITSASQVGTTATYNFAGTAPSWLQAGLHADITGMLPSGYNGAGIAVTSVGANSFTVTRTAGLAASTQGGTITMTYALGQQRPAGANQSIAANPPYKPTADTFAPISQMALIMGYKAGGSAITQAMLTRAALYLSTVDTSSWVTFKMVA